MDEQTLATKREQYRDALKDAVQRIATSLAQKPEVERAILFGSYARGRRDLFTDLDVLDRDALHARLCLSNSGDVPRPVLPGGSAGLHA
jgi:hypothetical protein